MLLEISDLKTHIHAQDGTVKAVNGADLSLRKGETVCLVGESGSGKSMLALSVIRLLPRDICSHPSGRIQFQWHHDGNTESVDLLSLTEEKMLEIRGARIAMIFQEPMTSLNPVFTVGEQIIEALLLHQPDITYAQAEAYAVDVLEQVQMPNAAQRMHEYPHRLSGGQRQRVMIAMALICKPDLLIADEPTTALDVTVQAEILKLMKSLQATHGTSILFITHDFGVAAKMADRIAVMYKGEIIEAGETRQIINNPQEPYTRRLIASLPENLPPVVNVINTGADKVAVNDKQFKAPLLKLDNVQVYFPVKRGLLKKTVDHIKAVDGVNLEIYRGEIVALVGESGCGKSTLGNAILRLIEATAGRIHFDGRDITHLSRARLQQFRRQMQIVFQDPVSSLNPRLTIATMLTEPMAVHAIGASREQRIEMAAELLSAVGLQADHLSRYPHEFSGGQRQRIGIARALALNPQFIVCDEVTSALDVSVQAEILQLLLQLREERQLTLLFISHNISVIEYISDRTAVMYRGKLVEMGETEKVCREAEHEYTRKLLDAVPRVSSAV